MAEGLDLDLGKLEFREDSLVARPENYGPLSVFSFHEVTLESREDQLLINVRYKDASEHVYRPQEITGSNGKVVASGRLHLDSTGNLVIDDCWDFKYNHQTSIPREVAETALGLLQNYLHQRGVSIKGISAEVDERVIDPFWINRGIRSFMSLDDYLARIKACTDEERDLSYDHPLEWKHGLYDNWLIAIQDSGNMERDSQALRKHLLGKGYEIDQTAPEELIAKCPIGIVAILPKYNPQGPYTFGVLLCPRDSVENRFEQDDSPIWKLQSQVIQDVGEFVLERDLPAYLPKTKPVPTFHGKVPENALQLSTHWY
jgi:hypothetical protein